MTRQVLGGMVLSALLAACGGGSSDDDGGSSGPPAPSALQVAVAITRQASDIDGTSSVEWYVSIAKYGVGVNSAIVNINGKRVPRVEGFADGYYDLTASALPGGEVTGEATYVPGQDFTVTVSTGGVTYTDTLTAPGGISLDPGGASASWTAPSTYATVDVRHRFGADTWGVPAARPGPLTSPVTVPASAYPSAGDYVLNTWLQNPRRPAGAYAGYGYFASLRGPDTYFYVNDFRERLVTRP